MLKIEINPVEKYEYKENDQVVATFWYNVPGADWLNKTFMEIARLKEAGENGDRYLTKQLWMQVFKWDISDAKGKALPCDEKTRLAVWNDMATGFHVANDVALAIQREVDARIKKRQAKEKNLSSGPNGRPKESEAVS
jgi:hypothetical protein